MISINWLTKVILVPKSYMIQIQSTPFEILQLDVNEFRLDLKAIEASYEGTPFPITHIHVTETLLSGVSYARIVQIINGYTIEFEDGQYGVSLYGANNNILDVKVPNQVSVLANNSAGLVNSEAINDQSYLGGKVFINTKTTNTGTVFPTGTPSRAVNNYSDAYSIAQKRKFSNYDLHSKLLNIPNTQILTDTHWTGISYDVSVLQVNGQDTTGCSFNKMRLLGDFNGAIVATDCKINDISGFSGALRDCGISGTIILDNTYTDIISIINCYDSVPGLQKSTIDFNGISTDVQIRGYFGGLTLKNITQNVNVSFDGHSATLELENTCIAGTINVGGITKIMDNSMGSTIFTDRNIDNIVAPTIWSEEIVGDINPNSAAYQLEKAKGWAEISATDI